MENHAMQDVPRPVYYAGFFLAYVTVAYLCHLMICVPPGLTTVIWLPAGVAFVALLLYGRRMLPVIFLASLTVNAPLMAKMTGGGMIAIPMLHAMVTASLDTLQPFIAFLCYGRFCGKDSLEAKKGFLCFFMTVALLPSLLTGWANVVNLAAGGFLAGFTNQKILLYVGSVTLSNMLGILLVATFVLNFDFHKLKLPCPKETYYFLGMLFILFFFTTSVVVMPRLTLYLTIPLLMAIAILYGVRALSVALFLQVFYYSLVAERGMESFFRTSSYYAYVEIVAFVLCVGLPLFLLSIAMEEVRSQRDRLEELVQQRTGKLLMANEQLKAEIVEREQLEHELRLKNDANRQFTYMISHDLKSPLVTVNNFLALLKKDIATDDKVKIEIDLQHISAAAENMQARVASLLEMAMADHVREKVHKTTHLAVVNKALVLVAGRIEQLGVEVVIDQADMMLCDDEIHLVNIWQNLIDNAVKFLGDQTHPRIEIGITSGNDEVVFFVRDNGVGIAAENKDKIFALFTRLPGQVEGTGMGLALVKRRVERAGGRIWVESAGPGQGSCFFFTLPNVVSGLTS